ncbi:Hypothetical protein NTJ_10226 [Nesidiocoris tenuis]|nr:Hypothetical protein NTJ_10226 [Nesidiocoris tenuis]
MHRMSTGSFQTVNFLLVSALRLAIRQPELDFCISQQKPVGGLTSMLTPGHLPTSAASSRSTPNHFPPFFFSTVGS